jgi:transcriptional regulator with XRE-family HTH domain
LTTKGKKLKLALRGAGYTQEEAANMLGISRQTLSNYLKMADFPDDLLQNVKTKLEIDLTLDEDDGFTAAKTKPAIALGEVVVEENESPYIDMGNGQFLMVVPLIPMKASAGYREHFLEDTYIDSHYDKHYFPVTRQYRGKYFAFVVDGDSMENWTSEDMAKQSIPEGSTVTGRDIPKHHWVNKFHLKSFQDYVIVHKDTILVKRITSHDTVNGTITCHSLNPDKVRHADFELNLNDCLQILNIVNVTQPR